MMWKNVLQEKNFLSNFFKIGPTVRELSSDKQIARQNIKSSSWKLRTHFLRSNYDTIPLVKRERVGSTVLVPIPYICTIKFMYEFQVTSDTSTTITGIPILNFYNPVECWKRHTQIIVTEGNIIYFLYTLLPTLLACEIHSYTIWVPLLGPINSKRSERNFPWKIPNP